MYLCIDICFKYIYLFQIYICIYIYIYIFHLSNVLSRAVIFNHKCFYCMVLSVHSAVLFNHKCFYCMSIMCSVRYVLEIYLSHRSQDVVSQRHGKLEIDLVLGYVKIDLYCQAGNSFVLLRNRLIIHVIIFL